MAGDNKSLGRFILDGVPPSPRGMPQVEVTFDVDANGILNVKAREKSSGKEQSIRIEARSGLSEQDIERMRKEAEANAETDRQKKESVDARNIAEQTVYTAEKSLRDGGDKVPADIKSAVEAKITALKGVKDGNDSTVIKKATEELSLEMQKIGEAMMKAQGSGPSPDKKDDKKGGDGNVRDADFKEEGSDKKN